jgi:polyhydroxyalkanoate synthesis regulator phasin
VMEEINKVIDANAALDKLVDDTVTGMQELIDSARQTGELAPEHLQPYLDTLIEAGKLTQENADLLMKMAEDAHVDWKAMQTSAERYGIALNDLGPAFDRKRLTAAAKAIVEDWEILNQEGVNTKAVLKGMSKSVQDLIDDAYKAGVDIPHNLKPMIEQMIKQGLLTDANGQKLIDMSQLEFAQPIEEKFAALITKIDELITKLIGTDGVTDAVKKIGASVENDIPDSIVIDVGFDMEEFNLPHIPSIRVPVSYDHRGRPGGTGGFQGGTHGEYLNFGTGTQVMLHGKERVMTAAEGRAEAGDDAAAAERDKELLEEIHGLKVEMRNLPRHLRDAILLSQ